MALGPISIRLRSQFLPLTETSSRALYQFLTQVRSLQPPFQTLASSPDGARTRSSPTPVPGGHGQGGAGWRTARRQLAILFSHSPVDLIGHSSNSTGSGKVSLIVSIGRFAAIARLTVSGRCGLSQVGASHPPSVNSFQA